MARVRVRSAGKSNNLNARVENGLKRGLILSGRVVAQRAQLKAPRDTGRLKRSLTHSQPYQAAPKRWAIDVGTNVEYAAAQEFGSGIYAENGPRKPITITPKNKQALSFEWPDAPASVAAMFPNTFPRVFFKKVVSKGNRPHPYLRPALRESKAAVNGIILRSVAGAMRGT